jgi:hypothetical protein
VPADKENDDAGLVGVEPHPVNKAAKQTDNASNFFMDNIPFIFGLKLLYTELFAGSQRKPIA